MPAHDSNSLRPSVWEWVQVALLVGNLGWTTLCLGGYRPETMVVTSVLTGALLVVHLLARVLGLRPTGELGQGVGAPTRFHPAGWLFVPFLVYAAANVVWVTPVPWLGWLDWLGWAQMIVVFWVVLNGVRSTAARAALLGGLAALGFVAVLLAAYQQFVRPDWLMMGRIQATQFAGRASGPFGIPNSLAAFLLLLLPPALLLTLRRGASAVQRVLGGYLVVVFALGLVLTVSRGAWLAFLLVLTAWPLLVARGRLVRRLCLAAGVAVALGAIGVTLFLNVPLVRERLVLLKTESGELSRPIMWRGAWRIFRDHPVCGGGGGSYNILFERYRPEPFQDDPHWAHNDYLNTLSDYGAVGFGLFFGACGVVGWSCRRRWAVAFARKSGPSTPGNPLKSHWGSQTAPVLDDPAFFAAMTVGIAAFGVQLFVDFHLKIPALAMILAVIAALLVQRSWPAPAATAVTGARPVGLKRAALVAAILGAGAGTVWWVQPQYRAEALRYSARQSIDLIAARGLPLEQWRPLLPDARAALARAVKISPANGTAWADLAYATVLSAHLEPTRTIELGREAEGDADQALARSKAVAVFWVRRGVALDLQGRWPEAQSPLAEAVRLAPARADIWYNYAFHLGLDRSEPGRGLAAVERCLRLDPGNREAQALRQRLADRSRAP